MEPRFSFDLDDVLLSESSSSHHQVVVVHNHTSSSSNSTTNTAAANDTLNSIPVSLKFMNATLLDGMEIKTVFNDDVPSEFLPPSSSSSINQHHHHLNPVDDFSTPDANVIHHRHASSIILFPTTFQLDDELVAEGLDFPFPQAPSSSSHEAMIFSAQHSSCAVGPSSVAKSKRLRSQGQHGFDLEELKKMRDDAAIGSSFHFDGISSMMSLQQSLPVLESKIPLPFMTNRNQMVAAAAAAAAASPTPLDHEEPHINKPVEQPTNKNRPQPLKTWFSAIKDDADYDSSGGSVTSSSPRTPTGGRKHSSSVRGTWTEAEDAMLIELVKQSDAVISWTSIATRIGSRNAKQCRERWTLNLDPTINHEPFTPEDDVILLNAHAMHGPKWAKIKTLLPGRTENSVKTRFKSLMRKSNKASRRRMLTQQQQISQQEQVVQ